MALLRKVRLGAAAAACLMLAAARARGETLAAVLSSETGPYKEALEGLREAAGEPVRAYFLGEGEPAIPRSARVVVAFGSKAALRRYPEQASVVYVMAPGIEPESPNSIKVRMAPAPAVLLAELREIQPDLKRLGVPWASPAWRGYVAELKAKAAAAGLAVEATAMNDAAELPERLRALYGKIDAIWVPPDPALLNAAGLSLFTAYSKDNRIPLYVPTGGLVERGATASVGPSFRELGRAAGEAALAALKGGDPVREVYASRLEVVISRTAAAQVGLEIPEAVLKKADKVLP